MNFRVIALGVVLFLIFWAFQMGYFSFLGTAGWFVAALIFSFLPWLFEMGKKMKKPPEQMKQLWIYATLFVVVMTAFPSFLAPYLDLTFPAGFDISQMTPLIISMWLIVFGGASLVHGLLEKQAIFAATGVIWLFLSMHFLTNSVVGSLSYMHLAVIVGVSFVLMGILKKD